METDYAVREVTNPEERRRQIEEMFREFQQELDSRRLSRLSHPFRLSRLSRQNRETR